MLNKNKKIISYSLFLFFFLLLSCNDLLAAKCDESGGELCDPLGGATPQTLIGTVINQVLGIVGSIALLMFIYGGFTWMTAAGNQEKVNKGKEILVWATVGLIVIFSSYALVKFVFTGLGV